MGGVVEAFRKLDIELIACCIPFSDVPTAFLEVADGEIDQFGGGVFGGE